MELFKLFGRVLVETSDAEKSLDRTDAKSKSLTNNLGSYMASAAKWASAIGTAVVAAATAVYNIASDVAKKGDEIDKESQKIGLSAQAYQEWAYILEHNGTSISSVGQAIVNLSKNVGNASEDTLEALERIGIGTNEALTMTPEELWEAVITNLQNMDAGTERTAISTRLFGRQAKELEPLLNSGAEATKELKDKVNELGGVMSDTLVSKSAEYEDAVTDLKTAWQGFKNDLAENTIPGMINVVNGFTAMLTGDFIPGLELAGSGIASFFQGTLETLYSYTESVWEAMAQTIEKAQYSLGGLFGLSKEEVDAGIDAYYNEEFQLPSGEWVTQDLLDDRFRHANGLLFVPRDNYPANLHYGERVLTRQEAEEYNSGRSSGGGFNQTVNISTVTTSPAQTAAAVRAAFETARWNV